MISKKALFSTAWMSLWQDAVNESEEYKEAGIKWNEPLILKFKGKANLPEKNAIGFYLDLQKGVCKELRCAYAEDESACNVILEASPEVWTGIITEMKDPLFLLMQGTLKMHKGSLLKLTSERKSAKALLQAAHKAWAETADVDSTPAEPKQTGETITGKIKAPSSKTGHSHFATTKRGLDLDSFPMQLFQRSKQLGVWNPADISFKNDAEQWQRFTELEKTVLLHLSSMFIAGEEAVTLDLLPLIQTVASEGRIEEEIYLTSFLWEEAKHTEFFALFLRDVIRADPGLEKFHGPAYKRLFYDELHQALSRLEYDKSPESQLKASVTYNLIIEGTLAETGYEAYYNMLTENEFLPGLREGIGLLKRDESRHIAFGLYFINRLLEEHPGLHKTLEQEAGRLLEMAIDVVHEIFEPYPEMPFGLEKTWYIEYASSQFSKRIRKLAG